MAEFVEVTITKDGADVLVADTSEDLWHDYVYFRDAASKASTIEPSFEQKRFLRAALVMFVAHCAATVERWCRSELNKEGKLQIDQEKWLRHRCLEKRCLYLYRRAKRVRVRRPNFTFKELRNRIIHVQQGQDLEVFRSLTPPLFHEAEVEMVAWFDMVGSALGYERLPNHRHLTEPFEALGPIQRSATTEPESTEC